MAEKVPTAYQAPRAPRRQPPGASPGPPREQRCANCGATGHSTGKCPKPKVDLKDRVCFKCGKKAHKANECRSPAAKLVEEENEQNAPSYTLSLHLDEAEFYDCDIDEEYDVADVSNQVGASSDVQAQGSVGGAPPQHHAKSDKVAEK